MLSPMASSSLNMYTIRLLQWCLFCVVFSTAFAQLSDDFYSTSCPQLFSIIESEVKSAISKDTYLGAPLMKIHVKDCLFGGCDGSILLNDTTSFIGGNAKAKNFNTQTGYEVIDAIKARLEKECPGVVSCADILAVVARDAVATLGGPKWTVPLGRRDSDQALKVSLDGIAAILLGDLDTKIVAFNKLGFTKDEYVALQGGHTVGKARCMFYKKRIHEKEDIDPKYAEALQERCPLVGGENNSTPLDPITPYVFDNAYFTNVVNKKGLLESDQELYTGKGGKTDSIVESFSLNKELFFEVYSKAFVKVGKMQVVTGTNGEVRKNCRVKSNNGVLGLINGEL